MFELFSQVETAISRSRGGLGIGLSLTKKLVELHGGSVSARSGGLGHGSEFEIRLRLPVTRQPAAASAQDSPAAGDWEAPPVEPLRILVADDNVHAAQTLAALLDAMGHTVRHVHDGQAAVRAAGEFHPDVVLLYIGMPLLNGYEVCKNIRAQEAGAKPAVLVACTGWGQVEDRKRANEAGFDHHLVKLVDPQVLDELLADISRHNVQAP